MAFPSVNYLPNTWNIQGGIQSAHDSSIAVIDGDLSVMTSNSTNNNYWKKHYYYSSKDEDKGYSNRYTLQLLIILANEGYQKDYALHYRSH